MWEFKVGDGWRRQKGPANLISEKVIITFPSF